VNRTLRIAEVEVAFGRKARLLGSPREGLESGRKPSFHCGREKSITARSKHRPKPPRTWVGDRTFDLGRNECHSNGLVFSICFVSDCHGEKVMNSERQASRFSIVMPEI
jgi:hypothetical protein